LEKLGETMKKENFHTVEKSISLKAMALSNEDQAKSKDLKQKMFDLMTQKGVFSPMNS
jgi:hypothetical protein